MNTPPRIDAHVLAKLSTKAFWLLLYGDTVQIYSDLSDNSPCSAIVRFGMHGNSSALSIVRSSSVEPQFHSLFIVLLKTYKFGS